MENILTERIGDIRELTTGNIFYLIDRSDDKERLYPMFGTVIEIHTDEGDWGFEFEDFIHENYYRELTYETMDEWMKGGVQVYRVFGFNPDKDDPKEVMEYIHEKTLPDDMGTCRECGDDFGIIDLTIDGYCYDCSYGGWED